MATKRTPRLPESIRSKLYKTGQTRGAAKSDIYQNRVLRNGTVLIPFSHWGDCRLGEGNYENGAICLIAPDDYFKNPDGLADAGLTLEQDALVFYSTAAAWLHWPPAKQGWNVASSRLAPLGGQYVARIPATTAEGVTATQHGFTTNKSRGAGIRVYEYAPSATIAQTRLQLEALLWRCPDAHETLEVGGMSGTDVRTRAKTVEEAAGEAGLLESDRLMASRVLDSNGRTVCPLCLEPLSARFFSDLVKQAAGRERLDNRVTEASMFHIEELRVGELGHRPYNVAWGHHYCNVVATDAGIEPTLEWMRKVLARNEAILSRC